MKYNSIMNTNGLAKSLLRLGPEITNLLLDMEAEVTEKIHGENFRVGVTADGRTFVGQRNGVFYDPADHPHWSKMNDEAKAGVQRLLELAQAFSFFRGHSVVYYGELCGNGMQSGFKYPWDGLKVVYFDILEDSTYVNPSDAREFFENHDLEYAPVYHESMPVREALDLDVNSMTSILSDEDYIEGVVIKVNDVARLNETWRMDSRFIIKHKSDRYSEMSKRKDRSPKIVYDSPFVDFVTRARIEHAVQAIEEREPGTIQNEMADMRYIIYEVLADIEREENDGNPLEKADKKSVTKAVPRLYQQMLNEQVKEQLGL